ncbi:MAG: uroporphyrinogen-III C-methyltransferase [Bacteroidota bacterium]
MNTTIINKTVTLVGAGPGDVELITLKGIKALRKAKVVLYDALVNTELLEEAPADAIKVFVGKRNNDHALPQEQINRLIVEYALTVGDVVRLKGGDSFVFGRGHEEIAYAAAFGVETSVVPGISSSIAVPALQQIPVTSRGVSESFWVITGCTSKKQLSGDVRLAAQSSATVVVLMGVNSLPEIVNAFVEEAKEDTAIAIIQNGSLPDEKFVLGTIANIEERAAAANVGAPAIIIIGKVVELHRDFVRELVLNNCQMN